MQVSFKGGYFKAGEVYALSCTLHHGNEEVGYASIPLPSTITPEQAAARLRELADWIEAQPKEQ